MCTQMPHYNCITAMLPNYTTEGDMTTIISTNGKEKNINKRVETVLNRLARSLSIDLVSLKEKSALATEKSIFQPLPLAPGLVLCPFKVRSPRVAGDTTIGYINYYSIIQVMDNHIEPYKATIGLIGGREIPILWTPATVKQHLQQARLVISYATYDPEIPPELSIHIYQAIKSFWRMTSFRHSPNQNFLPIP